MINRPELLALEFYKSRPFKGSDKGIRYMIQKDVDGFLKDEQVLFYIDEFADSGINMYVKFYATIEKFFDAKWDAMWKLKKAFDENGIEIPFNQVDVHMRQ